jgi:hypothetical protein
MNPRKTWIPTSQRYVFCSTKRKVRKMEVPYAGSSDKTIEAELRRVLTEHWGGLAFSQIPEKLTRVQWRSQRFPTLSHLMVAFPRVVTVTQLPSGALWAMLSLPLLLPVVKAAVEATLAQLPGLTKCRELKHFYLGHRKPPVDLTFLAKQLDLSIHQLLREAGLNVSATGVLIRPAPAAVVKQPLAVSPKASHNGNPPPGPTLRAVEQRLKDLLWQGQRASF